MCEDCQHCNPQHHHDHQHHHAGKSSESLLDKQIILEALAIRPGQVILDAGCGSGYMAKEFSRLVGPQGKVYALDPDAQSIATLREETEGTNIETLEADITTTTWLEECSFDLIYLSTVIHGFSKDQMDGFRKEIQRLLKPNGRLAIVEINKGETAFGPPQAIRFSPEELRSSIPLTPVSTVEIGPHFYMQIFENF